jgi:hypothetical protein
MGGIICDHSWAAAEPSSTLHFLFCIAGPSPPNFYLQDFSSISLLPLHSQYWALACITSHLDNSGASTNSPHLWAVGPL